MRKLIIAVAAVFVLGLGVKLFATTAAYQSTIRIVNSANTVINGVASATSAAYQQTVRVVDSTGKVIDSFGTFAGGVLTPASGGVGAMTGAPMWARNFGDGSDSAGPASGALANTNYEYTSWTCTGAITHAAATALVIRSQGTVALATGCSIVLTASNSSSVCDLGGAGGSGGSEGATNSSATKGCGIYNPTQGTVVAASAISALAAASASSVGNDGGAIASGMLRSLVFGGPPVNTPMLGGGAGSAGANTGGAAGNGNQSLIIIAPTITIASGVTLDVSGAPATDAGSLLHGGGGGGGAGSIWLMSNSFTDSGGIYKYGGGPPGNCTGPSIQVTGGGCNTTGCGTDAVITVTGVTTGGLDASKMTLTAAGTGYQTAPVCKVNANGSGLVGSPACHFAAPIAGAIALPIIDTAGTTATFSSYAASCQVGGYGANGLYVQNLIQ